MDIKQATVTTTVCKPRSKTCRSAKGTFPIVTQYLHNRSLYQQARRLISEMKSRLYSAMKLLKVRKITVLCNEIVSVRNSTTHDHVQDNKIVVTIPEDLPVNTKVDEYQVKAGYKKFYRRLRLTFAAGQANKETCNEPGK